MLFRMVGSVVTAAWLLGSAALAVCTAEDQPDWKTEFRQIYGLREGELVRRVAPPYAECRSEYFRDRVRRLYKRINKDFPEAEAMRDYFRSLHQICMERRVVG